MSPRVSKSNPKSHDLIAFGAWLRRSPKSIPEIEIWWFSGIDNINPRSLDLTTCDLGSRKRRNQKQKSWFNDLLAWAPDVDKINRRSLDLMNLSLWLWESTKSVPELSIWWLSGVGSRSRQNRSQKSRFDEFAILAPEVGKISSRSLDLMTFWPWSQEGPPANQPVSQPASHPAHQPASQPTRKAGWRTGYGSQPASQSARQQASQPASQPGCQPVSLGGGGMFFYFFYFFSFF